MSNFENADDGFRRVKYKRSCKKSPKGLPDHNFTSGTVNNYIDVEKAKQKIFSAQEDLSGSEYLAGFLEAVSSSLGSRCPIEVVSFGLGHISECSISRYQLALLLCLRDSLKVKVLVHDPIFYPKECELLRNLDIIVIRENEEGKYKITQEGPTIVYLPHCPKQLTNNFLWSNWGEQLKHCILICNSFTRLIDSNPDRVVALDVPLIYKIFPYTKEIILENNFKFTDIFNDTSLHVFPESKFKDLPSDFWSKGEPPKYEDTTEFITALVIEKLKL